MYPKGITPACERLSVCSALRKAWALASTLITNSGLVAPTNWNEAYSLGGGYWITALVFAVTLCLVGAYIWFQIERSFKFDYNKKDLIYKELADVITKDFHQSFIADMYQGTSGSGQLWQIHRRR